MAAPGKRVLCFDLDDTLWSVEEGIKKAEAELVRGLAKQHPEHASHFVDAEKLKAVKATVYERETDLLERCDYGEVRRRVMMHGLLLGGMCQEAIDAAIGDIMERWFYLRSSCCAKFPHADEVLAQLSLEYEMVAVTNGNARLDHAGIADYFHHHITPMHEGMKPKPCRSMFLKALDLTGTSPEHVVMIGDDKEKDIAPAIDLGMKAVLVDVLGGKACPTVPESVRTITCLSALPTVIKEYYSSQPRL
eukprot:TRINITY_DN3234_c0_g1_i1.p1 TRINITY_DN3234_c0_g1~~TRINITY_DN3234_c0_g1_i1.p1  ORF type:complete len:248 (+),score=30.16 TRINITY_DN3234_c0_g1_i1:86-829(+)